MAQNHDSAPGLIISSRIIVGQACIWLAFPVVIFLFGWFIWWLAMGGTLLVGAALYSIFKDSSESLFEISSVKTTPSYWWSIAGIVLIIVLSGHGAIFYQQWDWQFRNAVFFDLARRPWPVTYDATTPTFLCYYFAFFLPGALISKLTGFIILGDIVQFMYAVWGVAIAFTLLCSCLDGKSRWWFLPFMVLFSGADTAFNSILIAVTSVGEWWSDPLLIFDYFKSFSLFEQLALIFNQTIPCWVALPLIYAWRHSPGKMLFACSLLFVFAPLPCVGIALAVAYWSFREWKKLISVHTLTFLVIVFLSGLFFLSNSNGSSPGLSESLSSGRILVLLLVFLIFGIGIWLPPIWKGIKKNPVFWLLLPPALFLPFVSVGDSSDLGTRSAIPLMIFIFYAVIKALVRFDFKHKNAWFVYFIFASLISAYGAVRSIAATLDGYKVRPGKRFEMIGHLDDSDYNICYNNFIAAGESVYTLCLAPPLNADASKVVVYELLPESNDNNNGQK